MGFSHLFLIFVPIATGWREKLQEKYLVIVLYLLAVLLPSAARLPCCQQDRASQVPFHRHLPPFCWRNTVPGHVSAFVLPLGEGSCRPGAGKETRPYFFQLETGQCLPQTVGGPLGATRFSPRWPRR